MISNHKDFKIRYLHEYGIYLCTCRLNDTTGLGFRFNNNTPIEWIEKQLKTAYEWR